MGKAEVGSNKWVANKMKSKGLQRLRWWCEICQKQCRDANGFKCHVQSESHVRQMQVVGEDPRKFINQFSTDFQRGTDTLDLGGMGYTSFADVQAHLSTGAGGFALIADAGHSILLQHVTATQLQAADFQF